MDNPTDSKPDLNPIARAEAAAAELFATTGKHPGVREIREAAKVSQSAAIQGLREWQQISGEAAPAPLLPDTLQVRIEAIWQEAFTLATRNFNDERANLKNRIAALEAHEDGQAKQIDNLEKERDTAQHKVEELTNALTVCDTKAKEAERLTNVLIKDLRDRAEAAEQNAEAAAARFDAKLASLTPPSTPTNKPRATRKPTPKSEPLPQSTP